MITKHQKAILHFAASKLGLSEAEYRRVLVNIAEVTTSCDLDQAGFEAVMGFFQWMGFAPLAAQGPDFGKRPGFASPAQVELIRTLWREYVRPAAYDEAALNKWLLAKWKVSSLRFLTAGAAPKVITALKAMKARPRKAA